MGKSFSVLLIVLIVLNTGCFKTREVEPPSQASSDWISPTDYTILLSNLQRSVGQRNVPNYLRCFRQEEFVFQAATPVYTGNGILWDNWSWQDEQAWFNNVLLNLGLASGNYLELSQVDLQSFNSDSLRYVGDYELVMNH
ncbi:MAG TPA: hypothetical protein ENJ82_03550, partial [Bacteroidetes bacterium]|nr:hypothetical protein [Bacteroidota bacterium]